LQKGSSFLPYLLTILQLQDTVCTEIQSFHVVIITLSLVPGVNNICKGKTKKLSRQSKQESSISEKAF